VVVVAVVTQTTNLGVKVGMADVAAALLVFITKAPTLVVDFQDKDSQEETPYYLQRLIEAEPVAEERVDQEFQKELQV
jgi:ABC-type Fe2+-enterobactin transport system substrate-binding protein